MRFFTLCKDCGTNVECRCVVWEIIDFPKTEGLIVVNERELDPGLERLRPLGDVVGDP